MKIIDLLNKIENGEEVPKIIKYSNVIFEYDEEDKNYLSTNMTGDIFSYIDGTCFKHEIKVIKGPKKIEKNIEWYLLENKSDKERLVDETNINFRILMNKLNEIIDYINKGDVNE